MSDKRLIRFFCALCVVLVGLFPAASTAGHLDRSATVGGVVIHVGIIPAKVLLQDAEHYGEHNLQCKPSRARHSHHVLVALFDASSGERITDAEVNARISPLGLVGPRKHLHQVSIADAVTYCNYFNMSPTDTYVITVEIRRPGAPDVIKATFEYKPDRE